MLRFVWQIKKNNSNSRQIEKWRRVKADEMMCAIGHVFLFTLASALETRRVFEKVRPKVKRELTSNSNCPQSVPIAF